MRGSWPRKRERDPPSHKSLAASLYVFRFTFFPYAGITAQSLNKLALYDDIRLENRMNI